MVRGCLAMVVAAGLLSSTAWAERPVRFDLGVGASSVATPDEGLPQRRSLSGLVAASMPTRGGLRVSAEAQFLKFSGGSGEAAIPEVVRVDVDPTGVATFMLGMEWQAPLQASWAPFLHASMGAARVSAGDEHWVDMNLGAFAITGDTRTLPAWSAGVGLGGRPPGLGPGVFANARYTWTDQNDSERLKLTQVFAGVRF